MKDIREDISPSIVLASAAQTGTSNTSSSDIQGYDSLAWFCEVGAHTDGVPKVQHSDDDSVWVDAPMRDVIWEDESAAALPEFVASTNMRFGYAGIKQYARAVVTGATTVGIIAVLGNPNRTPAAF